MLKKLILSLIIASLSIGNVIAEDSGGDKEKDKIAYNTIIIDFFPMILGFTTPAVLKKVFGDNISKTSGFGIGAQYERNLTEKFSLAFRLDYFGDNAETNISLRSFEISYINLFTIDFENQFRYYPKGRFFIGALYGYTHLNIKMDGRADYTDDMGIDLHDSFSLGIKRNSIKIGARLGWRIRFGQNKGFTLETSLGYDIGIVFGDDYINQFKKGIVGDQSYLFLQKMKVDGIDGVANIFDIAENFIFMGGPRFSLSLGWSF